MPVKFHVGERAPNLRLRIMRAVVRIERGDGFARGQVAERQSAAFAARVLKMQGLPAILALKQLHCCSVSRDPPGRHERSRMA